MSFKDRMRELSTPEELHELIQDLLRYGSPNWTYDSARSFVPRVLLRELRRYFDDEGLLIREVAPPVQVTATEQNSGPATPTLDTGDTSPERRHSISAIVAAFHEQLTRVRAGEGEAPAVEPEPIRLAEGPERPPGSGPDREQAVETARSPNQPVMERPEVPPPLSKSTGVMCPICTEYVSSLRGRFRGRTMCEGCAEDLQSEFGQAGP